MAPSTSPRLAYLGPEGTYTHQAAWDRFRDTVHYTPYASIQDTFNSLSSENPFAVIPLENSTYGSVTESYSVLQSRRFEKDAYVRGVTSLAISHCLTVRKGTKMGDIKRVMSHEQALGQCQGFLSRCLPNAELIRTPSTAAAAQALLNDDERPRESAAICSSICSIAFEDLEILQEGVQDDVSNRTRFMILASSASVPLPRSHESDPSAFRGLLRLSAPQGCRDEGLSVLELLTALDLRVMKIDRRAKICASPFHDEYIVEVTKKRTDSTNLVNGISKLTWEKEVQEAIDRVRDLGGEVCVLGLW
ncbi:PDT-domain-containing protein [Sistotremastrum suecicum HHB10207 ss-3]|uniref:prephenate dehydratase n=1 Tax=Sistotremastrum suecicum HHB10207 ss-3 TaxID=1314776 RepID=A0A166J8C0_9AGAM|nr:PDT-domain-containing protein [Sistotremastrum suecicum HHB10207 ss-3]